MALADVPAGKHVYYQFQYRKCGKQKTQRCKMCATGPGHGPYWYAYWREGGRLRNAYIGKEHPASLPPSSLEDAASPATDQAPLAGVDLCMTAR